MSGFTEMETLRTWTFALVVIGLVGIVQVLVLSAVWPLV
jgi:GntP family gluconate:H+ symporter